MKLTNKQLQQIIKEELEGLMEEQPINESQKDFYDKLFRLIYDFRRTAFTDHEDMVNKVNGAVQDILKKMEKAPNIGQSKADQANAQSSVIINDPMMETKK
tara:strand:+ start:52 stop:354 length:303 start_codon:yes stop_codon:yes gene_type:complete